MECSPSYTNFTFNDIDHGIKVSLHSALMNTESRFPEILPSRILLIALEPIFLSKFCKKSMVLLILMAIERHIKQNFCFHGFGEGSFQNIQ